MSKQDLLKSQTCVLKVNIHCDGCKDKVKKLLSKIEGVYTVKIDAEQGKVTVTGNVSPEILVKKLIKSGKHAELSSVQKGSNNFQNQFKNMQNLDNFVKNNKSQKQNSGNNNNKDKMQQEVLKQIMKGAAANNKDHHGGTKNNKALFSKDHSKSSGKFNGDFDHSDSDDDDSDDGLSDDYVDGSLDGFSDDYDDDDSLEKMMKQIKGGPKSNGDSGKTKKSGGLKMPMPFMGMLSGIGGGGKSDKGGGKKGNKKENEGKKGGKNANESKKGGKNDKVDKKGGDGKNKGGDQKKGGEGKNGGKNGNNEQKNGKNKSGNGKKGGGNSDVFSEVDIHNKGKVGGGMGQMGPMGINFPMGHHMGGNPAVHGIPTQNGMNGGGYFQGMGHGGNNPYNNNHQQQQQQYMAMMMNQQRANGNGMHPQMMYARPQAPMNYGPPPVAVDNFTHMFSDENTGSCSIM